jgi:hypothetical protein
VSLSGMYEDNFKFGLHLPMIGSLSGTLNLYLNQQKYPFFAPGYGRSPCHITTLVLKKE